VHKEVWPELSPEMPVPFVSFYWVKVSSCEE